MIKILQKIILVLTIFVTSETLLNAEVPYFLDFKYILNNSDDSYDPIEVAGRVGISIGKRF